MKRIKKEKNKIILISNHVWWCIVESQCWVWTSTNMNGAWKKRRRRKTKQIGNNSFASSWMLALFYVHAVLCGIVTLTVCHPIVRFERILECAHCTDIHISECDEIHKRLTVHKYTAHCDGMSGYTHTCVSTFIERDRTQKQMKKKIIINHLLNTFEIHIHTYWHAP